MNPPDPEIQRTKPTQLYAASTKVHSKAVKGKFRTVKWWVMAALMAYWHFAPFIRWDRGPGAPDQAILIDLAGQRAYFFFIEIWPQEVYYLTGLLLLAAVTLFLMSAVAGRVWCGFLCFQTVYTDLFVLVERLIVGDRNRRIELDRKPWGLNKVARKTAVNALWLVISALCGISFALYFDDAPTLFRQIVTGSAPVSFYITILVVGGGCFIMAGYAREDVCIYMCPYSRFQAAMFDEHSLIISYDRARGEPRGAGRKGQSFEGRGHCVDCRNCVVSCPTGIDIREGNQLACIGCGLCIDACDSIMTRFGLPTGLIAYTSTANLQAREKGLAERLRLVRPRTVIYTALLAVVGLVMVSALAFRSTTEVNILHERNPLFVQLKDGSIKNGYTYKVLNMIRKDREFTIAATGVDGATVEVVGGSPTSLQVPADSVGTFRIYVTAPLESVTHKSAPLSFTLTDKADGARVGSSTIFAGPSGG